MRTIDKIITEIDTSRGASMGRADVCGHPLSKRVYDCAVPMSSCGAYDKGGAYWGTGSQLRVKYTKDLSYIHFYRKDESPK